MCGIVASVGRPDAQRAVARMAAQLHHRGPDSQGTWCDPEARVALGHTRLSIIDLSELGNQPMISADGRYIIAFNGEVYNFVEMRRELGDYPFRSRTDTEVVLAAWARYGAACLDRLLGMFAFVIWDTRDRQLTAVRDRLGVKPLYFARCPDGGIVLASEIKAVHAGGLARRLDEGTWATYLTTGLSDHNERTFWRDVEALRPGSLLTWRPDQPVRMHRWYDLSARIGPDFDGRSEAEVKDECRALMIESVRYRFRSDVPVGICLSGGLDSTLLLGMVRAVHGETANLAAYTFTTGDPRYDELPWVQQALAQTAYSHRESRLTPDEVPALAAEMMRVSDEPYGGIPTLAYAKLFKSARQDGVVVLLDGQGLDEQWAGYSYYQAALDNPVPIVQGARDATVRPECLAPEFARLACPAEFPAPYPDRLRNLQLRDTLFTKIPRALRFSDRASMMASAELREPFLDFRLFELALRQPPERKILDGTGKRLLRDLAAMLIPDDHRLAPKRPVQTPQREWLRGSLHEWATAQIEKALAVTGSWFDPAAVRSAWRDYTCGQGDNSFWVWQWVSLGLIVSATSTCEMDRGRAS